MSELKVAPSFLMMSLPKAGASSRGCADGVDCKGGGSTGVALVVRSWPSPALTDRPGTGPTDPVYDSLLMLADASTTCCVG